MIKLSISVSINFSNVKYIFKYIAISLQKIRKINTNFSDADLLVIKEAGFNHIYCVDTLASLLGRSIEDFFIIFVYNYSLFKKYYMEGAALFEVKIHQKVSSDFTSHRKNSLHRTREYMAAAREFTARLPYYTSPLELRRLSRWVNINADLERRRLRNDIVYLTASLDSYVNQTPWIEIEAGQQHDELE